MLNPWSNYSSKNEQTSFTFEECRKISNALFDSETFIFRKNNSTFEHMSNHTSQSQCANCLCFLDACPFWESSFYTKTLFLIQNTSLGYPEFVTLGCRQLLGAIWPQRQQLSPPAVLRMLHKPSTYCMCSLGTKRAHSPRYAWLMMSGWHLVMRD